MFQKKVLSFTFFLYVIFLIHSHYALPCECAARPLLLDAIEQSDLVVITKVVSVQKIDENHLLNRSYPYGVESTRMLVEKTYKGDVGAGEELVFNQGRGADCIYKFKEEDIGRKYLFFLNNPSDGDYRFMGDECGRSSRLNRAANDLLFLDNMERHQGKTRISGSVFYWHADDRSVFAGWEVRFIGKGKIWKTITNENGFYEIYGLQAGEYFVELEIPHGWVIDHADITVFSAVVEKDPDGNIKSIQYPIVLKEKRHVEQDIHLLPDRPPFNLYP